MTISILESFRCIEVYRVKRGMVAYEKRFLPMIIGFYLLSFVNIFAIMIFANEVPSSEDKEYGETKIA